MVNPLPIGELVVKDREGERGVVREVQAKNQVNRGQGKPHQQRNVKSQDVSLD